MPNSSHLKWKVSLLFLLLVKVRNYFRLMRDAMENMKVGCVEATNERCVECPYIARGGRACLQREPEPNTIANRCVVGAYIAWGGRAHLLKEPKPNAIELGSGGLLVTRAHCKIRDLSEEGGKNICPKQLGNGGLLETQAHNPEINWIVET